MQDQETANWAIKWLEELTTTEVEQCTGSLQRGESFCALGITRYMGINDRQIGLTSAGRQKVVFNNDHWELSFSSIARRIKRHPRRYFEPRIACAVKNHYRLRNKMKWRNRLDAIKRFFGQELHIRIPGR